MSDVTRCHKSAIGCVITMALWMLGEDCREQLCSAEVRRQTAQRRVGLGRSSRWLFLIVFAKHLSRFCKIKRHDAGTSEKKAKSGNFSGNES